MLVPETGRCAAAVIPFAGDPGQLADQIVALRQQEDSPLAEIVVAVNASEYVSSVSRIASASSGVPRVRLIQALDRQGPAYARNVGWRATDQPYVLFCDADDVVDRKWAHELVRTLQFSDLAGGRLEYAELNGPQYASWQRQSVERLPTRFGTTFSPSCSLGATRELLDRTGGFDETLLVGEDIDFCARAQRGGARLAFNPAAVVHYRLRHGLAATARQAYRYTSRDHQVRRALGAPRDADMLREGAALAYHSVRALVGMTPLPRVAYGFGALIGSVSSSVRRP